MSESGRSNAGLLRGAKGYFESESGTMPLLAQS